MSNIWTVHVSDNLTPGWWNSEVCYHCTSKFELRSWVLWLLENIPPAQMKSPDHNVRAAWVDKAEVATVREFMTGLQVIMVQAKFLKPLKFHEDGWHDEVIAQSRALTAYLQQLPDEWPCFLYQT